MGYVKMILQNLIEEGEVSRILLSQKFLKKIITIYFVFAKKGKKKWSTTSTLLKCLFNVLKCSIRSKRVEDKWDRERELEQKLKLDGGFEPTTSPLIWKLFSTWTIK